MSAIHWLNPLSGSFTNAGDWSGGKVPGASDDAILDAVGSSFTVTSASGETVTSLQLAANATLSMTGGTFDALAGTGVGANAGVILVGADDTLILGGVVTKSGAITLDSPQTTNNCAAFPDTSMAMGSRILLSGSQMIDPSSNTPIILRGFNWNKDALTSDADDNSSQGANMVRLGLEFYDSANCGQPLSKNDAYDPSASQTGYLKPSSINQLQAELYAADQASPTPLWVDLDMYGGSCDFYTNTTVQHDWVAAWKYLATLLSSTNHIGMYELMTEPSPPYSNPQDPNSIVITAYENAIHAIRQTGDTTTAIMVGSAINYDVRGLFDLWNKGLTTAIDPNLIYTANFYELGVGPTGSYVKQAQYNPTCQGPPVCGDYPGLYTDLKGASSDPTLSCTYSGQGGQVTMNKAWLSALLTQCMVNFRNMYNVPVFIDQIGIRAITPESLTWENEQLETFSANGIGFAHWVYRQVYSPNNIPNGGDISLQWQTADGTWHFNGVHGGPNGGPPQYGNWLTMLSRHFGDPPP